MLINYALCEGTSQQQNLYFVQFDTNRYDHLRVTDLDLLMKQVGEFMSGYDLREMIKEVNLDDEGTFSFDEFLEVIYYIRCLYIM